MRKLLILCMMICLSLSLVGCQKNPVSQNQENNQTSENTNTNQNQKDDEKDEDTNKNQVGTNENTLSGEINKDSNKDQEVSNENNQNQEDDEKDDEDKHQKQEEDKTLYINEEGILQLNMADVAMNYLGNEVTYPYDIDDMMKVELPVDPSYPSESIPAKSYRPLEMYFDFENHYVLCPQFFNGSEDEMLVSDAVAYNLEFYSLDTNPIDQGLSILNITLGMKKSDVLKKLGEPLQKEDKEYQWDFILNDEGIEGMFKLTFNSKKESAKVTKISIGWK